MIEVIPYIGPWLSAVPPTIYALVVDPVSALWVIGLFVFIYQVEGSHRGAERDGERPAAASVARDLRPARRRRALRHRRGVAGAAHDGRRTGDLGVLLRADPASSRGTAATRTSRSRSASTSESHASGRLTYPCPDDRLSRHAPAPPATHRDPARARAGDAAVAGRRRDATLRLSRGGRRRALSPGSTGSPRGRSTRSYARLPSSRRSACGPCCSSGSRRRRTRMAPAPGRPTASCSGRSGRSGPRFPA